MRQLTFRAWDGKEMWSGFHILPGDIIAPPAYRKHPEIKLEFMQYTGTKDKNGKEIYEGDIITHSNDGMKGVVTWSLGLYRFVIENLAQTEIIADLCDYDFEPQVLGNIHENQELLNG